MLRCARIARNVSPAVHVSGASVRVSEMVGEAFAIAPFLLGGAA
jgi:hypothetical protein